MAHKDWSKTTLGSLIDTGMASLQTGPFGSQLHVSDYVVEGVRVVPTEAIGRRRLSLERMPQVTAATATRLVRHRLVAGDILFARRGVQATGLSAIVEQEHEGFICGTGALRLRLSTPNIEPQFLSFVLASEVCRQWLRSHAVGAVMPNLNETMLRGLPLPQPPLWEQRAITAMLGALDNKIEHNRRMNETLEALARAIFKSWFVDFDPVAAKAAGRKPIGLSPTAAALFPNQLQDSVLGPIPVGWKISRLGEHVEAEKGLSYKGAGLCDVGEPLHNLNSVYEGGGYKYAGIKWYRGDYRERHIVRPGDVIVANTEQGHDCLLLGYASIIPDMFGSKGIFSHHLYRVKTRASSRLTAQFVCHLLNSTAMHDVVSGYGNGTTVNMLPVAGLQQPEFVCPPAELVTMFTEFAEPAHARGGCIVAENRALANLRDALLPKLMSGEIRLQQAERLVEEAVA